MRRRPRREGEAGSIAPVFLVILAFLLIMGWVLAGATATHYQQAARRARGIVAEELAQAGVEAAIALIDQGTVPPESLSGAEATGEYEVSITPTGVGTYMVESVGASRQEKRGIRAEVAPPPETFALLAGGNATVNYTPVALTGGGARIVGDIHAHGKVQLNVLNALVSAAVLTLEGDITAGESTELNAAAGLLTLAKVKVEGDIAANQDVRLTTKPYGGTAKIDVSGPITYGGDLSQEKSGFGFNAINLGGPLLPGGGAVPAPLESHGVDFYEALVADLEARGQMRQISPQDACGTPITEHTRVTGSLDRFSCWTSLRVEEGAVVVVDGELDVRTVRVEGLLYVRGGAAPNPAGHVKVGTLSLLEIVHSLDAAAGQGALVATGDVEIQSAKLLDLLTFGPDYGTVLQILALSTGGGDLHNNLTVGLGGLAEAAGGGRAAPLFLYTAGQGDITINNNMLAGALTFPTYPMIAIAGGDLEVNDGSLADVISQLTIEASPEIWQQVPPFLQGMGRARVLSWDWTNP